MTSKVLVSGKHPLCIRVEPALYELIKISANELNLSPNEYVVKVVKDAVGSNKKETVGKIE